MPRPRRRRLTVLGCAALGGTFGVFVSTGGQAAPQPRPEAEAQSQSLAVARPTPAAEAAEAAQELALLIQADEATYDQETEISVWSGNVEAAYDGKILTADRLIIDMAAETVEAAGNVALTEADGTTLYAERVVLTQDLSQGAIDQLRVAFLGDARLVAVEARREAGRYNRLNRAVFSTCRTCEENPDPLWAIKAKDVIHDEEKRRIVYRNARFELLGVPVFYTPYLATPDPTVKRLSGFLAPEIGSDTELGQFAEIPYFWVLQPNMDLTVAPFITTREGVSIRSEFRHRILSGTYAFEGSATFADREIVIGDIERDQLRGHLFGRGRFNLSNDWHWGFQTEVTSDDTYLRRYNISDQDRLITSPYIEQLAERTETRFASFYFQSQRAEDSAGETPIVPLQLRHEQELTDLLGGTVNLDVSGLALTRTEGADQFRASTGLVWERSGTTANGQVFEGFVEGRSDFYLIGDVGPDSSDPNDPDPRDVVGGDADDAIVGRGLIQAGVTWRWPFIRQSGRSRQLIEPIVQVILAPGGGNPENLTNEDSVSFEFDDTNLFSANRFPGVDLFEGGVRANVGVHLGTTLAGIGRADAVIGQVFRLDEDSVFATDSGLDRRQSDLVGRLTVGFPGYVDLTHRFRIDRENFSFERNEVAAFFGTPAYNAEVGYVRVRDLEESIGLEDREEVFFEGLARIYDNWFLNGGIRQDIAGDNLLSSTAGILFLHDCLEFQLLLRRRAFDDREIEPSTSVQFQISIPFGDGSAPARRSLNPWAIESPEFPR